MTWTWSDAAEKWLQETGHKRSHKDDQRFARWTVQHWSGRLLADIKAADIAQLAELKRAESSSATVNRYLAFIRAVLRRAHREWEWLDRAPYVRLYPERKRRIRWITPDQARALIEELPDHQRHAVLFALATGLRQGNVLGLRWDQLDMDRRSAWLYADQVKNGEDLHVSLNDTAMDVLAKRRGIHPEWVFSFRGKRIKCLTTKTWYAALQRVGIENFRWHDLRHTWASWLVQNGVPLYAVQEMGGWKSAAMVRRYAHLAPAVNLKYAKIIDNNLRLDDCS